MRFAAPDLGLLGGGGRSPAFAMLEPVGVLGADSVGARLERIRMGGFIGGSAPRSMADAERGGGAAGGGGWDLGPVIPGEAVCALAGGGGGGAAGLVSSPEDCRSCKLTDLVG